jgi:hypothetical protein
MEGIEPRQMTAAFASRLGRAKELQPPSPTPVAWGPACVRDYGATSWRVIKLRGTGRKGATASAERSFIE